MIFFSIGLPSRFTDWCEAVTRTLVEHALGSVGAVLANTLDEFALGLIRTEAPFVVVGSRQIGRLQTMLEQAGRAPVLMLDDPHNVVQWLVERYEMRLDDSVRAVASSCAGMVGCLAVPGALVLGAGRDTADPTTMAQAICRHFGLTVAEADIPDLLDRVASYGLTPAEPADGSWWDRVDEPSRRLAAGALDPYAALFAGAELGPITWERELFLINEEQPPEERRTAARPVDITGRSRILVHGPYIALPAGSWSVSMILGFSKEALETGYLIEICTDRPIAQTTIRPRSEEPVEVDLHFTIAEPIDQPIYLRIINERAAFDGKLALGHVTVTPHAQIRRETREYLATALSG